MDDRQAKEVIKLLNAMNAHLAKIEDLASDALMSNDAIVQEIKQLREQVRDLQD